MCKIWKDPKESMKFVEYYSDNKLEYMFWLTLRAMNYLHSENVYYGDMKPQNILVFKDYKLKIGDFGTAMKLKEGDDGEYYVGGLTEKYALPKIKQAFELGTALTKKDLFENDIYAIRVSFEQIIKNMGDFVGEKSKVHEMLKDVTEAESLATVVKKWDAYYESNKQYFIDFCYELMDQDKAVAAPQIFRHSTARPMISTMHHNFRASNKNRVDLVQANPIEEDELIKKNWDIKPYPVNTVDKSNITLVRMAMVARYRMNHIT